MRHKMMQFPVDGFLSFFPCGQWCCCGWGFLQLMFVVTDSELLVLQAVEDFLLMIFNGLCCGHLSRIAIFIRHLKSESHKFFQVHKTSAMGLVPSSTGTESSDFEQMIPSLSWLHLQSVVTRLEWCGSSVEWTSEQWMITFESSVRMAKVRADPHCQLNQQLL